MDGSIFEKIITGSASMREKAIFDQWIQESESNVVYFDQIKTLWEKSKVVPETVHFDLDKAKNKIKSKIAQREAKKEKLRKLRFRISVAATIIALLGLASLMNQYTGGILHNTIEYTAHNGVKEVILNDGSKVWINENSSLIVPTEFQKKQRNVTLIGEAFFEIKRDESRPFRVKTGKTITKVLGTSFNIKMDECNQNTLLTVNSGKVAFYRKNRGKKALILLPGEMAKYATESKSFSKNNNDNLNYLAWKTGVLIFKNTPLEKVCKDLSAHYKKEITTTLTNHNLILTGKFENENLDDILSTIQLTFDVKIEHQKNQIFIRK